eukprot:1137408-Pelagomonas_calceolata.AAC.3
MDFWCPRAGGGWVKGETTVTGMAEGRLAGLRRGKILESSFTHVCFREARQDGCKKLLLEPQAASK